MGVLITFINSLLSNLVNLIRIFLHFGIDLIIDVFAAPVALAYHAIKIAVKTYLKKYGVKKVACEWIVVAALEMIE